MTYDDICTKMLKTLLYSKTVNFMIVRLWSTYSSRKCKEKGGGGITERGDKMAKDHIILKNRSSLLVIAPMCLLV